MGARVCIYTYDCSSHPIASTPRGERGVVNRVNPTDDAAAAVADGKYERERERRFQFSFRAESSHFAMQHQKGTGGRRRELKEIRSSISAAALHVVIYRLVCYTFYIIYLYMMCTLSFSLLVLRYLSRQKTGVRETEGRY